MHDGDNGLKEMMKPDVLVPGIHLDRQTVTQNRRHT